MLVIIGESASGKSTLQDLICKTFNHKKVVTYTTRPIRKGEVDGVSYHYISDEEFKRLKNEDFLLKPPNTTAGITGHQSMNALIFLTQTLFLPLLV